MGVIVILKIVFGDFFSTVDIFSYILFGHFKMDVICVGFFGAMNVEERVDFGVNGIEVFGFVICGVFDCVGVHGIWRLDYDFVFLFYSLD